MKIFLNFDRKIEKMQTSLNEKDLQINELKQNYKAFETKLKNFEKDIGDRQVQEKVEDASKINETVLNESISALENSSRIQEKVTFECEMCNYKTESERG